MLSAEEYLVQSLMDLRQKVSSYPSQEKWNNLYK